MFDKIQQTLKNEQFRAFVKEAAIQAAMAITVAVVVSAAKTGAEMIVDKVANHANSNAE